MKNKPRQQRLRPWIAGMTGFGLMLLLGLGLSLGGFQREGQAQSDSPLLPDPVYTATPTVPPVPTPVPALAAEVLVRPSFARPEDMNQWEFVDVGVLLPEDRSVWAIQDGALLQQMTVRRSPNPYEALAFLGSVAWSDYTVQARFYDEGNGNAGLIVRRQGERFYRLRLLADRYSDSPKLILEKVEEGVVTPLATQEGPGFASRQWYDLSLRVQGDQLQATLDGTVILEAEDSSLTSGQPGLFTRAMGGIRFTDVVVTAPGTR